MLDMYLYKKKRGRGRPTRHINWEKESRDNIESVANWHNANAIHTWFINHVNNGVDDKVDFIVSEEQLKDLYNTCSYLLDNMEIKKSKKFSFAKIKHTLFGNTKYDCTYEDDYEVKNKKICDDLLPCSKDMNFGDIDYTSSYVSYLKETKIMLEKIFDTTDFTKEDIFYQAWY